MSCAIKRKIIFALLLCAIALAPLAAQGRPFPPAGFIETDTARKAALSRWLDADINDVSMLTLERFDDKYGFTALFSSEIVNIDRLSQSSPGHFSREDAVRVVVTVKPDGAAGVQGEWRLCRSAFTGLAEEIRIFPINDENVYLSITPSSANADKSFLSIKVYGIALAEDIPLGSPIERLYTASLESIAAMASPLTPWDIFFAGDTAAYADARGVVAAIRRNIGVLYYADDAAFDEEGRPVHIEDHSPQNQAEIEAAGAIGGVNCSGFVKWIVDGIVRPAAGSGLFIDPLKTPTSNPATHFTEPFREARDLFFGLDWCRNLAAAVVSLNVGHTVLPSDAGTDVTSSPFAGAGGYYKDAGYQTGELLPLLYWLAVNEPGCFYLAALSRERGDPPLRQFHHTAALFPYFDEDGAFTVAVFENGEETQIADFLEKNDDAFIHLSRVLLPQHERFFLQTEVAGNN